MKTGTFYPTLLAAALAVAGVAHAEVTLYKQPNFSGERVHLRDRTTNLEGTPLYDAASSIIVHSGTWEFCSSPEFRGDCVTLERGEYAKLDKRLNHRIESVRPVASRDGDRDRDRGRRDRGDRHDNASIELYGQPGFGGRAIEINGDTPTLRRSGLNDRTSSIVVNEGVWQLCTAPGFQGTCRVFRPGRYPQLDYGMDDQVSSARQIHTRRDRPWG